MRKWTRGWTQGWTCGGAGNVGNEGEAHGAAGAGGPLAFPVALPVERPANGPLRGAVPLQALRQPAAASQPGPARARRNAPHPCSGGRDGPRIGRIDEPRAMEQVGDLRRGVAPAASGGSVRRQYVLPEPSGTAHLRGRRPVRPCARPSPPLRQSLSGAGDAAAPASPSPWTPWPLAGPHPCRFTRRRCGGTQTAAARGPAAAGSDSLTAALSPVHAPDHPARCSVP